MEHLSRILQHANNPQWSAYLEATFTLGFEIGLLDANTEAIAFYDMNERLGCVEAVVILAGVAERNPAGLSLSIATCDALVDARYEGFKMPSEQFASARLRTSRESARLGSSATGVLLHALEEGYAVGVLTYRERDPRLAVLEQGFKHGCVGGLKAGGGTSLAAADQQAVIAACDAATRDAVRQYAEILERVRADRAP